MHDGLHEMVPFIKIVDLIDLFHMAEMKTGDKFLRVLEMKTGDT